MDRVVQGLNGGMSEDNQSVSANGSVNGYQGPVTRARGTVPEYEWVMQKKV